MALNKRERNLLIATIAIVVVGVNYFLVTGLLGPWKEKRGRLATQRRELAAIKAVIARQPEWQKQYDELGHSLNQSARFETISDVLKKIDELTVVSGILVKSIRTPKSEEHDVYREWPVACSFEASVESLVKFLHGLQTGAGFMTVEQLNVSDKPDSSNILRCEIQLRALAAKGDRPAS